MQDEQPKWIILSVAVIPETADLIKGIAKKNERSVSAELRVMVTDYLDRLAKAPRGVEVRYE